MLLCIMWGGGNLSFVSEDNIRPSRIWMSGLFGCKSLLRACLQCLCVLTIQQLLSNGNRYFPLKKKQEEAFYSGFRLADSVTSILYAGRSSRWFSLNHWIGRRYFLPKCLLSCIPRPIIFYLLAFFVPVSPWIS